LLYAGVKRMIRFYGPDRTTMTSQILHDVEAGPDGSGPDGSGKEGNAP
jgi:hypothetical protein